MRAFMPALAAILAFPIAAGAAPFPDWLSVEIGAGGRAITLTGEVATLTTTAGPPIVNIAPVSFDLADVTSLSITMDWAAFCEFAPGCVISAPTDLTVSGFAGRVSWQADGEYLLVNGQDFPDQLGELDISGPLEFTVPSGIYTDDDEVVKLTPIPEPASWAVLGIGLLGLARTKRRA